MTAPSDNTFDVIVVGGGISGRRSNRACAHADFYFFFVFVFVVARLYVMSGVSCGAAGASRDQTLTRQLLHIKLRSLLFFFFACLPRGGGKDSALPERILQSCATRSE